MVIRENLVDSGRYDRDRRSNSSHGTLDQLLVDFVIVEEADGEWTYISRHRRGKHLKK